MSTIIAVIVVVMLLLIAGFVWGYVRIQNRRKDVGSLITTVSTEEVPALVTECKSVFHVKLGKKLELENAEAAAQILGDALTQKNQMKTVEAFERPDHKGWFVKPMGAFLGELLRIHSHGRWAPAEGGGLSIVIGEEPKEMILHPFDKIEKQRWIGDPDDLIAYVKVAIDGPDALKTIDNG